MSQPEVIVGIDLGTTNSEVAALADGRVRVLGPGSKMLPSCVGLSPAGTVLIGEAARNQQILHPERTVRSVKRRMGESGRITLGGTGFSPQEVSALILKELVAWAERDLGQPVRKAVITVPAYFSDAQRSATREAGALAGLEVVRILNEPTAASLAYGYGDGRRRTVMVYDLGGGTFDVSVVTIEGEVTEVLSSHGNNRLGGDDFTDLLARRLSLEFQRLHGIDLASGHPAAWSRLWWAAEDAKRRLSSEPHARIREDSLISPDGAPLHLELEVSREEYEELIRPLVDSTLDSVSKALDDARKQPSDLDAIVLVGGSTRTPLVSKILEERSGIVPHQEVHPDLCVALGAGVLASRLGGHDVQRVLVDVSPFSFGPSYLGELNGEHYPHCYLPIIKRNTPLPVTRTESFSTSVPFQKEVRVEIYQGDDPDALKNILVGEFQVQGLTPTPGPNAVLCRMSLDIDGILGVTAVEKATGLSRQITIENALQPRSGAELAAAQERLRALFAGREADAGGWDSGSGGSAETGPRTEIDVSSESAESDAGDLKREPAASSAPSVAAAVPAPAAPAGQQICERARKLLPSMHDEDKEETIDLIAEIDAGAARGDAETVRKSSMRLQELLFFVEGA